MASELNYIFKLVSIFLKNISKKSSRPKRNYVHFLYKIPIQKIIGERKNVSLYP